MFWILEKNKAGADEDDAFTKICALPESRQLDVADRRKKVFQTENRRVFFLRQLEKKTWNCGQYERLRHVQGLLCG